MGIKGLSEFLQKNNVPRHIIHIRSYAGHAVAIDTMGFFYKYKALNPKGWLQMFFTLILTLQKNCVHPLFIFEGKSPPEKKAERQRRSAQREKLDMKITELRVEIDTFRDTGLSTPYLQEKMKKLLPNVQSGPFELPINIDLLEREYAKTARQSISVTSEDKQRLESLLEECQIQYCESPWEGETLACSLARQGIVSAVISNDSDVHAYGVQNFLSDFNGITGIGIEYRHSEVLSSLKMTQQEFLDLCIMSGCDYNQNIPNIGIKKSFDLLKKHKSIENIPKDTTCLNFQRCREIFLEDFPYEEFILSKTPEFESLLNYAYLNNIRTSLPEIEDAWKPIEFVD